MFLRRALVALLAAAGLALSAAGAASGAALGNVDVDYSGSAWSITPMSLTGSAGDTFTLTNLRNNDNGLSYVVLVDATGQVTMGGTPCTTDTSCPVYDTTSNPRNSGTFTVVTPGTLTVRRQLINQSISTIGTLTITGSTPTPAPSGPAITVAGVSPASGLTTGEQAITVTGTGFSGGSAPTVSLGGTAAASVTVVNDTTITAVTPARAAGTVDVSVSRDGGTGTKAGAYRYEQGYWLTVTNSQPPGAGGSTAKSTGAVRSAAFGDWTSRETVERGILFTITTYRGYAWGINCGNRLERKSLLGTLRIVGAETTWDGGPCRYAVRAGTRVRLSALPSSATSFAPTFFDDHWVGLFNRWTGDCTDTTSECSVTMNSDRSVRAAWGRFAWGLIEGVATATPEFAADGKLTYAVLSVGFVPTVTGSPAGQAVTYTMQATFTTGASAAARSTTARRVPACRGTARFIGRPPSATRKTTRGRLEARCTPTPALAAALRRGTVRVTAAWYLRAPRQQASYPLGQARAHLANRRAGAVTG